MKISAGKARIVLISVMVLAVALALLTSTSLIVKAQGGNESSAPATQGWRYVGAGLAVGLAGLGGGYAVGVAGASAVSAIAEKREVSGMALLIVALGEGIAIYGLLIGILVLVLK